MEYLLQEIEQKRNELFNTAKRYGLSSEKTIQISQELDQLLNTYYESFMSFLKR